MTTLSTYDTALHEARTWLYERLRMNYPSDSLAHNTIHSHQASVIRHLMGLHHPLGWLGFLEASRNNQVRDEGKPSM